ncbi:helix-turn-helix transcriptional regulator [Paenibacillus harenae]|uniref:helix-turn-helix transcriptional regulator n=1 Tax=Paenibacillus harenae TaxID=306543 RepID=UPI00041C8C2A|nr:LuxR family transcriptional regulator [Paenibacillus harenae]
MRQDESLDVLESRFLVGRCDEIAVFIHKLTEASPLITILNVYGTAGIGKSFLLDEFVRHARSCQALAVTVDCDGFAASPDSFCRHLLQAIPPGSRERESGHAPPEACIQALNELAASQRIVLFLDQYEKMESLDQWLRDYFLRQLHPGVLLVIAGRTPLAEPWFLSPLWRQCVTKMPLAELELRAVVQYAGRSGVSDEVSVNRLWRYSQGHPLTLSLITFMLQQGGPIYDGMSFGGQEMLPYIVEQWLREVPGEHLRPLIEAASVLRHFNQESLSYVLDRDISPTEFYRLVRFSFIRKADRGWTVHSLMREAVNQELLARAPQRYEQLRGRGLRFYYDRFKQSRSFDANPRDATELMYYIGDALVRAFMNWFDVVPRLFEQVGVNSIDELKAYVERRRREAKEVRIELFDSHSNSQFNFSMTAEQTCYTLKWLDFDKLFSLGYDVVRVIRDPLKGIVGVAVVIPINRQTLPYLKASPRGSAYFSSLSAGEEAKLAVPATTRSGWFIETIDTESFNDASQQTAIGHLLHALIFTQELIVESPAPISYFIETHKSLGFEAVPGAAHTHYDGRTPADTFVIDMRNEKLISYIHRMIRNTGAGMSAGDIAGDWSGKAAGAEAAAPGEDRIMARNNLTQREKEVAKLLEQGLTNIEIAAKLYLSEATIKKHMKSMLAKLNASNRTQLLKKLLE